ncbi:hypothetical protein ACJX0J_012358, partial [Zea mays]
MTAKKRRMASVLDAVLKANWSKLQKIPKIPLYLTLKWIILMGLSDIVIQWIS